MYFPAKGIDPRIPVLYADTQLRTKFNIGFVLAPYYRSDMWLINVYYPVFNTVYDLFTSSPADHICTVFLPKDT
jgi:hypothetical protein